MTTAPLPVPTEQYLEDRRWIQHNIETLVRDHANQWVAVHRGTVLASGPDAGEVLDQVQRQTTDEDVVYQFIDDGTLIF